MVAVDVVTDTGWWDGAIMEVEDLQRLFAQTTREILHQYAWTNGPRRDLLYSQRAAQSFCENQLALWGDWSW